MCPWCCLLLSVKLLKSDLGERSLLTYCDMLTSTLPVHFVNLEIKTLFGIYTIVFSTVSFAKVENSLPNLLQIIDIPYWILKDFDMVNLSNLEIAFCPFITVA